MITERVVEAEAYEAIRNGTGGGAGRTPPGFSDGDEVWFFEFDPFEGRTGRVMVLAWLTDESTGEGRPAFVSA